MNITTYKPNYRSGLSTFTVLRTMYRNIMDSRFLIQETFKRDFTAGYKKSFLGIIWLVIGPLVSVVSWIFLQRTGLLNPGETEVPYPVYVLVGTLAWDFFVGVFNASSKTLSAGKDLVLQVKYHHEAFFIKQLMLFCANFFIRFTLVILAVASFGVFPSWKIVYVPLLILPIIFSAGSVGLLTSLFVVITADVKKISNIAFKFLIWTVPVVYSGTVKNEIVQVINYYNPLTYLVCTFRDVVLFGRVENVEVYLWICLVSFIFFLFSLKIFYVAEEQLVEKMI